MIKKDQKIQVSKAVKDARIKRELKKIIDENFKFYQPSRNEKSTLSR
jgi:hypothetical protein